MSRYSIVVALFAVVLAVAGVFAFAAQGSAKTAAQGCGCVDCKCPDCNGEFCTCDDCACGDCACAAAEAKPVVAAAASCCAVKSAARVVAASDCGCEVCLCPNCNRETCSCETCECVGCAPRCSRSVMGRETSRRQRPSGVTAKAPDPVFVIHAICVKAREEAPPNGSIVAFRWLDDRLNSTQ